MNAVAQFIPKTVTSSVTEYSSEKAISSESNGSSKICHFKNKEVDMMPGDWAEPFNPTPYELCTTIHTCKRLHKLNKEALEWENCDQEATLYNIKVLEKLYIHLMSYLVE